MVGVVCLLCACLVFICAVCARVVCVGMCEVCGARFCGAVLAVSPSPGEGKRLAGSKSHVLGNWEEVVTEPIRCSLPQTGNVHGPLPAPGLRLRAQMVLSSQK